MIEEIRNNIDFFIRSKTRFSRKNYVEKNNSLIKRNEAENNYIYAILDKIFLKYNKDSLKILDIGSKNWFYAKALYNYFNMLSDNFEIDGVEIDAYRLYTNLYSRFEVAKYYIKDYKNLNYIPDNLLNINKNYDYITWFLPFVLKEPLLYWGLPEKYFCPEKLLSHAYSLLKKDGQMLIINQGEVEADAQEKLLNNLNIQYKFLGEIENQYFNPQHKRFGFLITN